MSDPLCTVDGCGRPVHDQAYVCQRDGDLYARNLAAVSALVGDLEVTISRQSRTGGSGGRTGAVALPFDEMASEIGWVMVNTLTTWARHVAGERGLRLPYVPSTLAAASVAARWLTRHVEWLRHRPEGAEAMGEIRYAVGCARAAVDLAAERVYAGPCDVCGAELYGRLAATVIVCRVCGTEYDVAVRRAWLLEAAADTLLTAAELSRALPGLLDRPLSVKTVRTWAATGRIVAHGVTATGFELYRVSEVSALAQETPQRHHTRQGVTESA